MPGVLLLKIFGHLCITLGVDKALSSPQISHPLDGNSTEQMLTTAVLRIRIAPVNITCPEPIFSLGGVLFTPITFPPTPTATTSVPITVASFAPPGVAIKGRVVQVVNLKKRWINPNSLQFDGFSLY